MSAPSPSEPSASTASPLAAGGPTVPAPAAVPTVAPGPGSPSGGGRADAARPADGAAGIGGAARSAPGAGPGPPRAAQPTDPRRAGLQGRGESAEVGAATPPAAAGGGAPAAASKAKTALAEQRAAANLDVAREKVRLKLYDQAVAELKVFSQNHPDSALVPEAAFLVAEAQRLEGKRDEAMGAYVEFASRHKEHARVPEALYRLAQLKLQAGVKGTEEDIRVLLGEIAEKHQNSDWAPRALADQAAIEDRMKVRLTDPVLAASVPASLVTLRALVDRYPTHALAERAYWSLADVYEDLKRYAQAADACERLATAFPATKLDAWFRAGEECCSRRLKDDRRARRAYEQVPSSSPKYKDAQKRLGAKSP